MAILDRDEVSLDAAVASIAQCGAPPIGILGDLQDPSVPRRAIARCLDEFSRLDVLVNNAGVGFRKPFVDISLEEWERVFRINATSAFLLSQEFVSQRPRGSAGRIINMASVSGLLGSTGRAAYGSSKAALIQLTRILAVELAPLGIAVNAIAPGPIETRITSYEQAQREAYLRRIPAGCMGTVEAVAAAAMYLADPVTQYINGQILGIDGGLSAAGIIVT